MTDHELKSLAKEHMLAIAPWCEYCRKSGFVQIYHRLYRGLAWINLKKRDGTEYPFCVRAVAFCNCLAGEWARLSNNEHDPRPRLDVVLARRDWELVNPMTIDPPPEICDGSWMKFARWLRDQNGGKEPVVHLPRGSGPRPQPEGDPIIEAEEIPF